MKAPAVGGAVNPRTNLSSSWVLLFQTSSPSAGTRVQPYVALDSSCGSPWFPDSSRVTAPPSSRCCTAFNAAYSSVAVVRDPIGTRSW